MNNKYIYEVRAPGGIVLATFITKDDAQAYAGKHNAYVVSVATGL